MYIGIDIGGTKTAVLKASINSLGELMCEERIEFKTSGVEYTLDRIIKEVESLMPCDAIGISCGGPLDEKSGIIMSPPNLPGWDSVEIVKILSERFCVPVALRNDANACALAEWRFGAGKGCENMAFLTFGTGLGAGLIINGKLYSGANGNAGEIGHIRLAEDGPIGYGKAGSFEGFCSGGGIAELGRRAAKTALLRGEALFECTSDEQIKNITTKMLAECAKNGDADAIAIFNESARKLGAGLAVIIDSFNPERIVIGSIYERSHELFEPEMRETLKREALGVSLDTCQILPAKLGDKIGDYAAISVAMECKDILTNSNDDRISELVRRYPALTVCEKDVRAASSELVSCYNRGGKILLCGNGGSCSDCEHVAGELLKGFIKKREPIGAELSALSSELGEENASRLQRAVPAIPLPSLSGVLTAFMNDVDPKLVYAQLVYALSKKDDVLIAFSTSGNSENVVYAVKAARALGIKSIALTGKSGGKLAELADIVIKAPECETFKIQEYHLPIYHAICCDVEEKLF